MLYDYREYFIAIAAIFLALALGILVGVTFGEDFLVSNQREIIDLMESELGRLKSVIQDKDTEIKHWEQLTPILRRGYQSTMSGLSLALITKYPEDAASLNDLFRGTGAHIAVIILDEEMPAEEYADLLAQGSPGLSLPQYEIGMQFLYRDDAFSWPPQQLIMLPRWGDDSYTFSVDLWRELHRRDIKITGVFPWGNQGELLDWEEITGLNVIDNIDTIWGQIALLEMISFGQAGRYGFSSREGLIPAVQGQP